MRASPSPAPRAVTTRDLAGVVIHGPALSDGNPGHRPGEILLTANGGATWSRVRF